MSEHSEHCEHCGMSMAAHTQDGMREFAEISECPRMRVSARVARDRLAAAAPDLLAACKAALKFVAADGTSEGDMAYEMLTDAIAKAEGRP